jgi:Aspartyl protease
LNNEARIFWSIDCWSADATEEHLTARVKDLVDRKDKLNSDSPQIPPWARKMAEERIKRGETDFAVDAANRTSSSPTIALAPAPTSLPAPSASPAEGSSSSDKPADTGASSVSLTPEMAARARITPDASDLVDVKVVAGLLKQATGYAQTLQVAEATAANVPVLIAVGSKDAFGPGIDGLLGMTFLSRYTVSLSPGLLELKPRNRNISLQ